MHAENGWGETSRAKLKPLSLGQMRINCINHGVIVVIVVMDALVRSFVPPPIRGGTVGGYLAIGAALVEALDGLLPCLAVVAVAIAILFTVIGVNDVALPIAQRLPRTNDDAKMRVIWVRRVELRGEPVFLWSDVFHSG